METANKKNKTTFNSTELLNNRLNLILPTLEKQLAHPWEKEEHTIRTKHYVISGIGSSEAHARFLVWLLHTFTPATAEFRPFSGFDGIPTRPFDDQGLIVFSQGLSPNSHLAIAQSKHFVHTTLFTAVDPNSSLTNPDSIRMLHWLKNSVLATTVPLGSDEEKGLLMRVLGPMVGYVSAIQWAQCMYPQSIPSIATETLLSTLKNAKRKTKTTAAKRFRDALKKEEGFQFLTPGPLSEFAQNLLFKFLEGLITPCSAHVDLLAFGHGPFQQLMKNPKPILLCLSSEPLSQTLLKRAKPLMKSVNTPSWVIQSDLPLPWRILEYEMILNHFILDSIKDWKIDPAKWPGIGLDQSLYSFGKHQPTSSSSIPWPWQE
jgi:hypothetical protein